MYLAWFDANPKKPTAQKIAEAHERYVEKFGRKPRVCLVNPGDVVPESPVELRPLTYIGRHCFWIGVDEADEPEVAAPDPAPVRRTRKPKAVSAAPVAAVAVAPEPATMPTPVAASAPKRRTRREKAAA
jgi:hypothetical protein